MTALAPLTVTLGGGSKEIAGVTALDIRDLAVNDVVECLKADGMLLVLGKATTAPASPASELAYAAKTSDQTITTTQADISGLSVTFDAGVRPIELEMNLPTIYGPAADRLCAAAITDSSNTQVQVGFATTQNPATLGQYYANSILLKARLGSLTPGSSYTYKGRINMTTGGTLACASDAPASLSAKEV